jgi:hypothetical protein
MGTYTPGVVDDKKIKNNNKLHLFFSLLSETLELMYPKERGTSDNIP